MGARIFATKLIQYINVNNMQYTCCTYPAICNALIYTYTHICHSISCTVSVKH